MKVQRSKKGEVVTITSSDGDVGTSLEYVILKGGKVDRTIRPTRIPNFRKKHREILSLIKKKKT